MEGEQELVCDLSDGAISNDLERTLTLFQGRTKFDAKYLTNGYRYGNSYYRLEGEQETAPKALNGTTFNDLV